MAPIRVPAWRRSGLVLKSETATSPLPQAPEADKAPPSKRRKISDQQDSFNTSRAYIQNAVGNAATTKSTIHSVSQTADAAQTSADQQQKPTSKNAQRAAKSENHRESAKARKSVSFSTDTKAEDGQSTGDLINKWRSSEGLPPSTANGQHLNGENRVKGDQLSETAADKTEPSTTTKTHVQKSKKAAKSNEDSRSSNASTEAVLTYLDKFHMARDSWKFNKTQQIHLLKQVLDPAKIPSEHDAAIHSYITGLQGVAAKERLREAALASRHADAKDFATMASSQSTQSISRTTDQATPNTTKTHAESNVTHQSSTEDLATQQARNEAIRTHRFATLSREQQREAYEGALSRWKENFRARQFQAEEIELIDDPKWQRRLQSRRRAELILASIGEAPPQSTPRQSEFTTNSLNAGTLSGHLHPGSMERSSKGHIHFTNGSDQSIPNNTNGINGKTSGLSANANGRSAAIALAKNTKSSHETVKKRRRKRKRRTGVPDDDTSSDESESEAESAEGSVEAVASARAMSTTQPSLVRSRRTRTADPAIAKDEYDTSSDSDSSTSDSENSENSSDSSSSSSDDDDHDDDSGSGSASDDSSDSDSDGDSDSDSSGSE